MTAFNRLPQKRGRHWGLPAHLDSPYFRPLPEAHARWRCALPSQIGASGSARTQGPRLMAATERLAGGVVEEAVKEENPGALKPGAAPFGNFPHYSRFHPPEQRLRLLPPELLRQLFPPEGPDRRPILGLDVGCNSGVSDAGGLGAPGAQRLSAFTSSVELAQAWHGNLPKVGF